MADHADIADTLIEEHTNMQVAKIRQLANARKARSAVCSDCEECGNEVPKARLELGYVTCVACQTLLESRQKHYRRA